MRAEGSDRASSVWPAWFGLFSIFFSLYALTANRGVQWQDPGVHILRMVRGELVNPRGLALSHPLHYWLGRAAIGPGILEPSFAITLVSAFCGAIAVANVFGCVRSLTRSSAAGAFSAVSLGVAHTFWQLSTTAETYTVTAALLAAECWCIAEAGRSRRGAAIVALALFNGLGLANHDLALLTAPVVAGVVYVWTQQRSGRGRIAAIALGAWVLGSLPFTGLVAREILRSGEFIAPLRSALFGNAFAEQVLALAPGSRQLVVVTAFFALNFPNLLLLLAGRGIWMARRRHIPAMVRRGLLASLVLHFLFAVRYPVIDQHTFLTATYVLLAVFGGVGIASFSDPTSDLRKSRIPGSAWALLFLTPAMYAFAPTAARRANVLRGIERHKPYRDDYVTLFTPWSVIDDSAERMSRHAVGLAGADGLIVVEDPMSEAPVRYRLIRNGLDRVEMVRPSVRDQIEAAAAGGRTVVLVPQDVNAPKVEAPAGLTWRRDDDLYVLGAAPNVGE